ncbi:GntR family transcriptional regulator [Streptomyces longwoodensis]|uniref:GntR family transcriptional regulator n=1 Tax=Streptomyces longwoodensis TaxID=68231 RepID=UPI003410F527
MAIERRPMREQVIDELLERLGTGRFTPGETINEVQLAEDLGVSRTPLREALISLEREGIIVSERGRGFRFVPTSAAQLRDLTEVIIALECLALRSSDREHLTRIAPELLERAREFSAPEAKHGAIERYDVQWHAFLLSGCRNTRLMELIDSLKLSLHRYERAIVGDQDIMARSAEEHERIAQCLLNGDVEGAATALETNWTSGMKRIIERLVS